MTPFDPTLPLERAHTLPADWYTSGTMAQREGQLLFSNVWLLAGRADQLARPGDFFTCTLAGEPLVFTRDEAGQLHGLVNVCRHRAAKVACAAQGHASMLRCRYHGWTYDLAGNLRGVPEFAGVEEFRREDHGLPRVAVAEWGPLLWVHLGQAETIPPLSAWLGELDRFSLRQRMQGLQWVARRDYHLACNWKVFVDNYLDGGYHVNTVHPTLAGILDYARYRTELLNHSSVQISPLEASGSAEVDRVRGGQEAYYVWIFPNTMLNIYEGVMDVNVVLPDGPDHCRVIFDFYFAPDWDSASRVRSIELADQIQREDEGVCLEVQDGLRSRTYRTGRFSVKREAGGYHFHRLLAQWILPEQ
ncbi:MAG: aromatic ring-hydroxylating dioxygenase subunit alpha [Gemmataceae bacterium]